MTNLRPVNQSQQEAWKSVLTTLGTKHIEVISTMLELGGNATVGEIASRLGKQLHQVSGRISELCARKLLSDSGTTRPNPSTLRNMTVWILNSENVEKWLDTVAQRQKRPVA